VRREAAGDTKKIAINKNSALRFLRFHDQFFANGIFLRVLTMSKDPITAKKKSNEKPSFIKYENLR